MALFSSDNDDKKLSQGSSVKSSSLLSSKDTVSKDAFSKPAVSKYESSSALNSSTSTVKTLNPTSSSPFASSSAGSNLTGSTFTGNTVNSSATRSSAFSSTASATRTTSSVGTLNNTRPTGSAFGSTLNTSSNSTSRFQSSSTLNTATGSSLTTGSSLNRTSLGTSPLRTASATTSSLGATAPKSTFSSTQTLSSRATATSTLSGTRPASTLSSVSSLSSARTNTTTTARPSAFGSTRSTQTTSSFTPRATTSSSFSSTTTSTLRSGTSGSSFTARPATSSFGSATTATSSTSASATSSFSSSTSDFTRKIEQAKAALSTVPKVRPVSVTRDGKTSLVTEKQEVTDVQYRRFAAFIEEKCGIVLGEGKQYLVNSRLSSLLSKFRVQTVDDLINKAMEEKPNNKAQEEVIDAMTTNETLWFRDTYPYKALENIILPELAKKAKYPVRIWSAACSSGQEPYSIGMVIQEQMSKMLHIDPKQTQIIGTDLSPEMLSICRRGQYDVHALSRGLSAERKEKFFRPTHHPNMMAIDSRVKSMVEFRPMNLLGSYALMGRFDVIFCRNVLIYFSNEVKADILRKLTMCLNPGGYLILGSTETLVGVSDKYEMMRCNPGIIYHLKPQKYAF